MKKPPVEIINLITLKQVGAILDAIDESAFGIELTEEDDAPIAMLMKGGREIFRVNLRDRIILRRKDSKLERVYTFEPQKWWRRWSADSEMWGHLAFSIKTGAELGGTEALTTNLLTRTEIILLIDAIRAMVFKIDAVQNNPKLLIFTYESREVFRLDLDKRQLAMTPLSGASEVVYTFADEPAEWFWGGTDRQLWKDLLAAMDFFRATMHKVRMSDYRATFGAQMQRVIIGIAKIMEDAESDLRMLERVDTSEGGRNLHPEVARLVQKDLDAGEEAGAKDEE